MSRRAILQALTVNALATRLASAQTQVVSKAKPLARDAVTHDWTAFLGPTHNAISTETRLSRKLAAAPGLGVHQGHRLRVAGDRGRAARVPPSAGRRRDRRVPARGDGRDAIGNSAIPPTSKIGTATTTARDRARSSTAAARLHGGRAGAAALPRPRNRKRDLEARPATRSIASLRIFSGRASTPLIEGQLLDRECRRARRPVRRRARQDDRTRSLAGRQGVGAELRVADSRGDPRKAARASCLPEASRIRRPAD